MLKLAEPLEGSTCTEAACTLGVTPALLMLEAEAAKVEVVVLLGDLPEFEPALLAVELSGALLVPAVVLLEEEAAGAALEEALEEALEGAAI